MAGQGTDGNRSQGARGTGEGAPAESDLAARLKRLERQIEERRPTGSAAPSVQPGTNGASSPLGQAMRLSAEFVAGVLAGGALGWAFDRALGTRPWGLIVLLLLGFVAGIYNVMRATGQPGPGR